MILDAADFASRENISFIRLNDAFRKTLLKAAKKTLRQPTMRTKVQCPQYSTCSVMADGGMK